MLDLRSDRYSALPAEEAERLRKQASVVPIRPPAVETWTDEDDVRIHFADTLRFLTAFVKAHLALKWQTLETVVSRVRHRKLQNAMPAKTSDTMRAGQLIAIAERLRPFVFSAHNRCLFESLLLIEYLARYRIFPDWVFGVHMAPFNAHCWVQYGDVVLNDTLEHARSFTPIMAV